MSSEERSRRTKSRKRKLGHYLSGLDGGKDALSKSGEGGY